RDSPGHRRSLSREPISLANGSRDAWLLSGRDGGSAERNSRDGSITRPLLQAAVDAGRARRTEKLSGARLSGLVKLAYRSGHRSNCADRGRPEVAAVACRDVSRA